MIVLIELAKENIDLEYIKNTLKEDNDRKHLEIIAPSSGLMLYDIKFL